MVKPYRTVIDSTNFVLVDTPGFNDTRRNDGDILKEIADWLNATYREGFKLTGVVYLQPINVTRMEGTDLLNFRVFRKLCGKDTYKHIVLASTFWDLVDEVTGARREKELCDTPEFWGKMIDQGSRVTRIQDYADSKEILLWLAGKSTVTLGIQKEMVDQKMLLSDTATGKTISQKMVLLKAEHDAKIIKAKREAAELVKQRDEENHRKAKEYLDRHNSVSDLAKALADKQRLQQERILIARLKDAEKEAGIKNQKEIQQLRLTQEENKRLVAEKNRLARELEVRTKERNAEEEMTRAFLYRSYRAEFNSQFRVLEQARSQNIIRAHAYGFHQQSSLFSRWCDKCFKLISFEGFYRT